MNEMEKLRVLLSHWIEHNKGHGQDCDKWSAIARKEGADGVATHIDEAVEAMNKVNELLEKALQAAGGSADDDGHHHHHHHHH